MTALRIAAEQPAELTEREHRVLALIAEGRDRAEIAAELSYSESTVKNLIHDILHKLGARTQAHAVSIAYSRSLLGQATFTGITAALRRRMQMLEQENARLRGEKTRALEALLGQD